MTQLQLSPHSSRKRKHYTVRDEPSDYRPRHDSILGVAPNQPQHIEPRNRRPNRPQRSAPLRERPSAFSHDDLLQQYKGKSIQVMTTDGMGAEYTLLDADKFALVLLNVHGQRGLVFKHAIVSISFGEVAGDSSGS